MTMRNGGQQHGELSATNAQLDWCGRDERRRKQRPESDPDCVMEGRWIGFPQDKDVSCYISSFFECQVAVLLLSVVIQIV